MDPEVRLKITQCALKIAKHCDYINAGTVEFLLEPNSKTFYFIEVNPRLQVEHTITEEILGLDLVQLQILIASGATLEQLSLNQQKIQPNGYAIQCRIQADKGHVQEYKEPSGRGIRVDSCCYSGYSVSGLYDAVIAKLITHGPDFHASVMKALHALDSFVVEGIHTNIPFLKNILSHPKFLENQIGVRFLDLYRDDLASTKNNHSFISAVLPTSILQYLASTILNSVPNLQEFQALKNQFPDLSFPSEGFSSPLNENQSIVIQVSGGKSFEIIFLTIHSSPGQQNFIFSVNGTIRRITILKQQSHPSNIHNIDTNSQGTVISPVSGYVVDIRVQEGNYAESGTPLILLTEMKMEHSICAPISSNVVQYFVKKGDYVSRGQIVAILNEQTSNSNNSATRRVSAIGTHLLNQTGWLASLEALKKQKQLAYQLGGPKGIQRQKSQGKLTVRERISLLLDKDSFQEIGSLSGKATYNENNELETFTAANCVGGKGEIKKKPVIVVGDDFTIRVKKKFKYF